MLLEPARPVDYAIWVVAFLFYAWDAARLLAPREMLLVEAGRGRLRPLIGDSPFGSGGRVLAFGPLHLPFRGAFLAGWGRPWADAPGLAGAVESLQRLRDALGPARAVASVAFALLFLAGPVVTVVLGPDVAVLIVAALLYPTVIAGIVAVWRRRIRFGFTGARALWLSLEVLVCPAFLPNLVRKITMHRPVETDGAQVLAATAAPEIRDEFLARLATRAEDMIEADASDPAGLRAYLAGLRSAR